MQVQVVNRTSQHNLRTFGTERLVSLCAGLGLSEAAGQVSALFQRLLGEWGAAPLDRRPSWHSHVGDDSTPYEFSVAFGRRPELRMMVEPLGAHPSLASNGAASLALLRSLAKDYPVDLTRLAAVQDLFLPDQASGAFAMWVAASFDTASAPSFKIYLSPEAHGVHRAPAVIEEALVRLGLRRAWPCIGKVLAERGPKLDELKYFSLDLSRAPTARVKVYARHRECTREDLERTAELSPHYQRGEITRYLDTLAPETRTFASRFPFTCYAFVEDADRPASVTTHFPIQGYASNDAVVRDRVVACLEQLKLPSNDYAAAIASYADRPLENGIGLHSYVSLRRDASGPRLTAYLPVEAYGLDSTLDLVHAGHASGTTTIVARYEDTDKITNHPFLLRLRREDVNLAHVHRLLSNFQISISKHFARRLAAIIARVDDDRVRCILAEQLNDEMGNGKFERAHVNLFASMMAKLTPWKTSDDDGAALQPGRDLDVRLASIYGADDVNYALGAVLAGEVFGKQLDQFLGDEFRRQRAVDVSTLEWLVLHEQLEVEHADSSAVLELLLPADAAGAAADGADAIARAGWRFLDDLYALCFGH